MFKYVIPIVLINYYVCCQIESQPVFLRKSPKNYSTCYRKLPCLAFPISTKSINALVVWKRQKSSTPVSLIGFFPVYKNLWRVAKNLFQNFFQRYGDSPFIRMQNVTNKSRFHNLLTPSKLCLSCKQFSNNSQLVSIVNKNCRLSQHFMQKPVSPKKNGSQYQERLFFFQKKMLRNSKMGVKNISLRKLLEMTNDTVVDNQDLKGNKIDLFSKINNLLTGKSQEVQEREEKMFLKKFNDKYDAIKEKHKKKRTIYLEDARVRHGEVIGGAVAAGTVIVTLWILKRSKRQRNHVNSYESYFTSSTEFLETDDSCATSASSFFEQYWNHFENMVEVKSTTTMASYTEHPLQVSSYMIPSTFTFRLAIARHLLTDLVIPYPSVSSLLSEDDSSCCLDSPTVFTTHRKITDANLFEAVV